jgi:DNA topoisomerase-1
MNRIMIIVESPAKARTISKMLPDNYIVKSSYGHITELPKSKLGFDPSNNFKPEYEISKDKIKKVRELRQLAKTVDRIILASDDDREGEVIAWSVANILKLDITKAERIVFHEITKKAIVEALKSPGRINMNLVDAGVARRVLDRAVGYKLSPLLWKKIKYGLSAGRVQSAAVKIIVDKEREINAFVPEEFWKLKLDILSDPQFKAELSKIDGKGFKLTNETEAMNVKNNCDKHNYILSDIVDKENFRKPPPPFTTSTLQQAASSKLGFGVKQTMSTAQKLYDGSIDVPNHTGGLITYMRTDSVNLSKVATDMAKQVIAKEYGSEYTLDLARSYTTKSKGAQEAHEAVRPVNLAFKPSDLKMYLDHRELKLYTLIWSRTMATQMANAKVANTTYKILGGDKRQYEFVAKGTKILFPGFLKAYDIGTDDTDASNNNDEKFLPNVPKGTIFDNTKLTAEQNFTTPPARYSEASLVKKLEAVGVGRPATYASTISTILQREYVIVNDDKKLEPTIIGTVVNDYLVEKFNNIVDVDFTANIESEFDKIAEGKVEWQSIMQNFYGPFIKAVEANQDSDRVQYSSTRELGIDPESKLPIYVKEGKHGCYIQVGDVDKEKKQKAYKISPVPKGTKAESVTYEQALHFIKIPRVLGIKDNEKVVVAIGRFGPYITTKNKYYNLKPSEVDIYTINLEDASVIIDKVDEERAASILWSKNMLGHHGDVTIINGRFGPYIARTGIGGGAPKANFKLPTTLKNDVEAIKKLTEKEVLEIIEKQTGNIKHGLPGTTHKRSKWKKKGKKK